MMPLLRLPQLEQGAPGHHLAAEADELLQDLPQGADARLAVHDGQHGDGEAVLKLGLLVELVQHDVAGLVLLQLHHQADALTIAFVAQVADAVHLLVAHQFGNLFDEGGLVDLVGQFREDQLFPIPRPLDLLHVGFGAHHAAPPAGAIGIQHAFGAQHEATAGEVWALDVGHEAFEGQVRLVDEVHQGAAALPEVVGRDAGGHAHGDALGAIHQQIREARRQDDGLFHAAVVVGDEIHRVLVDVPHHLVGHPRQAGLGVAHGRRGIPVDGAEVALAIHQHVAHGKGLGHADEGVVDRRVAMGMVLAHHVADGAGGLLVGPVPVVARLLHGKEHPAVHGLEAVADIGQGPAHDDAHGVVQVGLPHLFFDFQGFDSVLVHGFLLL